MLSREQAEAHQRKHGFLKEGGDALCSGPSRTSSGAPTSNPKGTPKPRQNQTEREYGLILEAMKRRGEIIEYRYEGVKLAWGADPVSKKQMYYTPDFFVVRRQCTLQYAGLDTEAVSQNTPVRYLIEAVLIEVKNSYIRPQDWIRFKGCRAEWPMFIFELHQKANGEWRRLL